MQKKTLIILSIVIFSISCVSEREKQKKDAKARLSKVEVLISQNNLGNAKIELDSIHLLYPKLVEERRFAQALEDTVIRIENQRNLDYFESILPEKKHQADSIAKKFRFEKNSTYQDYGHYVYNTLRIESNIDRNYLRAYVDENADFFLISNFTANYKLNHTRVKVSVGDNHAQTEEVLLDNPMNHKFSDNGMYFEIVTFKNEIAGNVPLFIAENPKGRIEITLEGEKSYNYYLNDFEKKALNETYNLWVAKKDVVMLEKEIQKATYTIEKINQLYQSSTESSIEN